jgi:hypothetical protein
VVFAHPARIEAETVGRSDQLQFVGDRAVVSRPHALSFEKVIGRDPLRVGEHERVESRELHGSHLSDAPTVTENGSRVFAIMWASGLLRSEGVGVRSMRLAILVIALSAAALSACAGAKDRPIISFELVAQRTLRVSVSSCSGNPTVDVDESATTVVLRARGGDSGDDCADGAIVTLREPLGERVVMMRRPTGRYEWKSDR